MKALYGERNPPSASDVIEGRLIEIGLRALELGSNVVIDFGLWGRHERSALRQAAADRGAGVEMDYLDLPSRAAETNRSPTDRRAAHHLAHLRAGTGRDVPTSCRSQHQERSTAANRSMIHPRDSRRAARTAACECVCETR